MSTKKTQKILPILFFTLLLDMIGIGMIIPIIPILFTDPTSPHFLLHGYSTQAQLIIAGAMTAVFGIMQFLAAPLLGELSDIYGRKRLLSIGVAVLALSQIFFGLGVEFASLSLLFLSRIVAGLGSANFSIAQATIADITEPKNRAKNFGLMGAAFGVGFIVGPVLSGWLTSITGNPALPFWFSAALGILNLLSVSLFLPETHERKRAEKDFHMLKGIHNIRDAFRDVDAFPIYCASFLFYAGFAFYTSFSAIMLVQRFGLTEGQLGAYFGASGIWLIITQLFLLRIVTRYYRERQILSISLLVLSAAVIFYPFLPSMALVYIFVPVLSVPIGLSMANMGALVSKSVSVEKQGAALGISGSLSALSQGVVPLLAGTFAALLGVRVPFLIGGVILFLSWTTLFVFHFRLQKVARGL